MQIEVVYLKDYLDPNKFRVVLKLCQNHYMSIRNTGNYENSLSRLFAKNFVKATVFTEEVNFTEFFSVRENFLFFHITVYCARGVENYGNLLSHFFSKNFVKTTFLQTKLLNTWFDEIFFGVNVCEIKLTFDGKNVKFSKETRYYRILQNICTFMLYVIFTKKFIFSALLLYIWVYRY